MYRTIGGGKLELLLVHPGGPFFRNKDDGAWTIPKGELEADEEPLENRGREYRKDLSCSLLGL